MKTKTEIKLYQTIGKVGTSITAVATTYSLYRLYDTIVNHSEAVALGAMWAMISGMNIGVFLFNLLYNPKPVDRCKAVKISESPQL